MATISTPSSDIMVATWPEPRAPTPMNAARTFSNGLTAAPAAGASVSKP